MREERRREEMREMDRGALKTIPVEGGSASASEHTSRLRVQRHIQNKESWKTLMLQSNYRVKQNVVYISLSLVVQNRLIVTLL
jgi:hypothetical protein